MTDHSSKRRSWTSALLRAFGSRAEREAGSSASKPVRSSEWAPPVQRAASPSDTPAPGPNDDTDAASRVDGPEAADRSEAGTPTCGEPPVAPEPGGADATLTDPRRAQHDHSAVPVPADGERAPGASEGEAVPPDRTSDDPLLTGLGGRDNIESLRAVAGTRLRVALRDIEGIDVAALDTAGAAGIMELGDNAIHVVVGPTAPQVADRLNGLLGARVNF